MADPALVAEYVRLTGEALPERAKAEHWPLVFDHCFRRVVLDHLFGGRWYDHLDRRRPAYRQLDDEQLRRAVALARRILGEGRPLLVRLNAQSLAWRAEAAADRAAGY